MAKRALAHIEKIEWVKSIEGADNIELIGVLGWICIAKKNEFKAGDLAVYIEIDSKCPENEATSFAIYVSAAWKGMPHIGARSASPQSLPVKVKSNIFDTFTASSKNIS